MGIDILTHNRIAWDALADRGDQWTVPVSAQEIEDARRGRWAIVLTPIKPVPAEWLDVAGKQVLCLASGGGQQAPILAAAGADVTVLDNSPKQLESDARTARQHGLSVATVRGDMADLHMFRDRSFDLVVHPVSNCFVPDVLPVWREAFRVLRGGGYLLAGFANPVFYIFDQDVAEQTGRLEVTHSLPYADVARPADQPLEFGHTLEAQIGGQVAAGFSIIGMYEDGNREHDSHPLNRYTPTFIATRALKPKTQ